MGRVFPQNYPGFPQAFTADDSFAAKVVDCWLADRGAY